MTTPQDLVLEIFYGRWRSQTLHAGVALGVFEAVREAPRDADAVADTLGLARPTTQRLLRALAALGVLAHVLRPDGADAYRATEAGALLRADHPQSMRDAILLREGPEHLAIWKHLVDIVRTGRQDGFVREYGVPAFEHAVREPRYGRAFDAGMSSQSNLQTAWALEALRGRGLERVGHLCDVGGGQGHVLAHLLLEYPSMRGTVVDRAQVVADAGARWTTRLGVADRCAHVAGDMFSDVPPADAYAMKLILHDWDDAQCVQLLRTLRRRAPEAGRLFVIEHVVRETGGSDHAALFDMHMLCWGTGRERTEREYRGLFETAGWRHVGTWFPANGAMGVVEGVAA
jgi:hypothetical protein